jgi:hypothetical protein
LRQRQVRARQLSRSGSRNVDNVGKRATAQRVSNARCVLFGSKICAAWNARDLICFSNPA